MVKLISFVVMLAVIATIVDNQVDASKSNKQADRPPKSRKSTPKPTPEAQLKQLQTQVKALEDRVAKLEAGGGGASAAGDATETPAADASGADAPADT